MTPSVPALTPFPLSALLSRVVHEWPARGRIFDLPTTRFFRPAAGVDLSVRWGDRRVATPVGPAAGPHTQLAQNIVLGWLAGARFFELKTVQVLDRIEVARPCIDLRTVGFNVEWSQELTLAQSREEYVKAWLMLALLRRWEPLKEVLGHAGDHVFELSVGYDLQGVRSPAMAELIDSLRDADATIAHLRGEIPASLATLRDLEVDPVVVDSATLSTFHGCPPEEIAAIARHLMDRHGLDVTVKLNPTLLGEQNVAAILHDQLGYRHLRLLPAAFAKDMSFAAAVDLVRDLATHARRCGRTFGIKLTNTLVVANDESYLPGEQVYLSGQPLHVLAVTLLDRLVAALPGRLELAGGDPVLAGAGASADAGADRIPVAFSAGVDRQNLPACAALGLLPVTICSDLLRPGGYGRLAVALRRLEKTLGEAGCADLAAWQEHAVGQAQSAGYRDPVAAYAAGLGSTRGARRYTQAANAKPPRQTDRALTPFDCSDCTNCVTVCPNDAFSAVATPEQDRTDLQSKRQYLVLAELCNECGNCTAFCPEVGDPSRIKPRLYRDRKHFEGAGQDGWLLLRPRAGSGPSEGPEVVAGKVPQVATQQVERLLAAQDWPLPVAALEEQPD